MIRNFVYAGAMANQGLGYTSMQQRQENLVAATARGQLALQPEEDLPWNVKRDWLAIELGCDRVGHSLCNLINLVLL
jgi:hypothetical protein